MDPTCLSEEEIRYELALRHVSFLSSVSRRARAVRLRTLMQEDDMKGIYHADSSHVMNAAENIDQCMSRVHEMIPLINAAYKNGDLESLRQSRSRLMHYRDRLAIIEPPPQMRDTYATLVLLVQFSLEDIEDAVGRPKKRASDNSVNSDATDRANNNSVSAATNTGAQGDQATPANSNPTGTGAIPKSTGQSVPRVNESGRIQEEQE